MELTATGTAISLSQGTEVPYTIQFDLAGGSFTTAGCDSALLNANITDFSAVIGGVQFNAPASFLGNMTVSPYPTCSGPKQVEITSAASNWLTLNYAQTSDPSQHSTFTGAVGNWYIASGNYTITAAPELSVPEPSVLALFACACAILLARRAVRR